MIKTFTIYILLGASCFSSALQTGGQIVPGHLVPMAASPNRNLNPSKISWTPTQTPGGNHLENGPLSRSQESENEINGGNNEEGAGDEMPAATEDKQLPPQQQQQQQQQHGAGQISPQTGNKRPNQPPQQQVQPTAYSVPMGNHPPGMPVTQYSGVQMMGYQKELSGQQPMSHQQQMFYSGGSNSIPMIIYSDSERPPITMFLLSNGDKQLQGSVKTGDFIPNFQPMSQMPMMYTQNIAPLNIPMPYVETPSSPLNWDRQLSMFDTYSSPQYYPSSNILIKSKENEMSNQNSLHKQMKPKFAENSGMSFENDQFGEGRAAILSPIMSDMTNMKKINMNPRAMETPWMIPQRPRLEKLSNLRSMMDWGLLEPRQSMVFEINEPMERSSSNNWESPLVGSRYTSLPTSPYTSQYGNTGSQGTYNTGSTSYQPSSSQFGSTGSSSYLKPGSSNTYGTSQGSSHVTPSSTKYGQSYLTPGSSGQYGQGSSSLQGQGSSSYLTPGSSYSGSGSTYSRPGQSYQPGSSYKNWGILGSTQQQLPMNQHMASPYNLAQESYHKFDKNAPPIAIVPVVVMMPGEYDQTGPSGHIQHQHIPGGPQHQHISGGSQQQFSGSSSGPVPASKPRSSGNAPIVGMPQYGLGLGGLGGTGLIGGGYGNTGLNNQYSNAHNGHLGGQNSQASNNQQYGQENFNTNFVQPLPSGGVISTQVNTDKGFSGSNFGQGSQSLGVNDQNFNAGGLNSNQGYNNRVGVGGGILPGLGVGGGLGGLNTGIGLGGVGGLYG